MLCCLLASAMVRKAIRRRAGRGCLVQVVIVSIVNARYHERPYPFHRVHVCTLAAQFLFSLPTDPSPPP
jgi:hypothetical protein